MAKYLIILTLCILGASLSKAGMSADELMNAIKESAEACKNEVGATQADLDDMIAKEPATSREGKCMRACVMQKCGALDATGHLVKEVALDHAKVFVGDDTALMKIAEEVIGSCAAIAVPGDKCDNVEVYKNCLHEGAQAHGVGHVMF